MALSPMIYRASSSRDEISLHRHRIAGAILVQKLEEQPAERVKEIQFGKIHIVFLQRSRYVTMKRNFNS